MRNIWRIIKADARSLFTHFFALAVALAIAVLPSLYAWLNIYSNWDPYGNTGNISIAVASLDKGWTEEDGVQVNKGREVVEDLRSSTSINWVIVDTKEEAQQGVYAGDYYAAVVIDEDFSYNMYHMLTEWTDKPTITYYENYKKNAVATKITDTAVSSLKTTISKSYLDVVVDAIFRGANDLSQQLSQEDPVGSVQGLLGQTRSLLRSCAKTIDAFQAAGQDNSSYRQDLSDLVANINQNRPDGQQILDTVAQLNRKVHAALDKAQTALDKAFDAAEKFLNGIDVDAQLPEIQENLRDAAQTMDDMGDRLMAWAKSVALEAVRKDAGVLYDIPQTAITPLVADTAVRGDPRMIQWVPRELRTADLCLYAEAAHPELRVYVPDEIAKGRNIYSFHRQVDAKLRQPLEYEQYKTLYSGGAVRVNNVWTSVAGEIDCCEVRYDRKTEKLKLRIVEPPREKKAQPKVAPRKPARGPKL